MPIYEYRCGECGQRSSHYYQTFSAAENASPTCPRCHSANLRRLVSRVSQLRSEDSRLENLDESSFGGVDEDDPKSVARWARKMGQQFGEDLGDDWDEMVDQMEGGEMPGEGEGEGAGLGGEAGGLDDL